MGDCETGCRAVYPSMALPPSDVLRCYKDYHDEDQDYECKPSSLADKITFYNKLLVCRSSTSVIR